MNIADFMNHLSGVDYPVWVLPSGEPIPSHYHITEVGVVHKAYIDCGGQLREEKRISLQIRYSNDVDHRLGSEKLLTIVNVFQQKISQENLLIEVEYQGDTIQKYGVETQKNGFSLVPTHTDCLAKDACGIPPTGENQTNSCCGGGCC